MSDLAQQIVDRAIARYDNWRQQRLEHTDRTFAKLLIAEWVLCILFAFVWSPYAWEGRAKTVHPHVWVAVLLGAAIMSLPLLLIKLRPGQAYTRHAVAIAQMLFSGLLIHLTGGRIETHFHIFGSLAFLAFYMDWKVLLTATVTTAADHFIRGLLWPESIYGIVNPEWWRALEHGGWVIFCVAFLSWSGRTTLKTFLAFAEEGGMLEALAESERIHSEANKR